MSPFKCHPVFAVFILALFALIAFGLIRNYLPSNRHPVGIGIEEGNRIEVTSTDQEVPFVQNGNCTLGEAIKSANDNQVVDACAPGVADRPDVIVLKENTAYEINAPWFAGDESAFRVTGETIIEGNGSALRRAVGAPPFRFIFSEVNLAVQNLTFQQGEAPAGLNGGAIRQYGELTLDNCHFRENRASRGGAIESQNRRGSFAALTITNSTFSGNFADVLGGGGGPSVWMDTGRSFPQLLPIMRQLTGVEPYGWAGEPFLM